jgi:chromosome segregation protein
LQAKLTPDMKPSYLQGEVTRLNNAIAALGAVNMAALDELAAATRAQGLPRRAIGDLNDAIGTLEDAIHKIDQETRDAAARHVRRRSTVISASCSRVCSAAARRS